MNERPPPPLPSVGYADAGSLSATRRSNGPAIASLICGLLGCVPFVTGAVAVGLAWAGLRKARDPHVGGKGMAIAGLVFGLASLAGWLVIAAMGGAAYADSKPARATARQFLADLSAGNSSAAAQLATPNITPAEIQSAVDLVRPWGALNDVTFDSYNVNAQPGTGTHIHLTGRATYARGMHTVVIDLLKQGKSYQVWTFQIQ